MNTPDDFESIRDDPDPIRRGQRAGDLIVIYQQRAAELARLRKAAIEEAHHQHGRSYTEIAELLGLTKGRISQIRTGAPQPERAFFGVGPVTVGIPRRAGFEDGRKREYFDANDQSTQELLERMLTRLALVTTRHTIAPDSNEIPHGDVIMVCGPKSAPVARRLQSSDGVLAFENFDGRWTITDSRTGKRHDSPFLRDDTDRRDIGLISRSFVDNRVIVYIAGITSIGSTGVAHWLGTNLAGSYDPKSAFMYGLVECEFDKASTITASRIIAGPYDHGR
ncbi:MAG: sigma-70 family RNA polymerase sigma factor [Nocardia sp.]|nr:sigma-70 family RNA polymerase sigma factor [Nocardia sp.]